MAIGLSTNKAWFEKAFVSIAQKNGAEVECRSFTSSFSRSGGGIKYDSVEVFGGKLSKPTNREDFEISFDAIPASTRDLDWIFHGASSTTTTISSNAAAYYRVTLLWTDQTGITSAAQALTTVGEAYRQSYAEGICTALDYSMDAGEQLTASMKFSLSPEDETGGVNIKIDTKTAGATLGALAAYTSTTKF